MPQKSFVAEGWALFHRAILRAGAEVDYFPPDEPALRGRAYVSPDNYRELACPLIELAGVDIESVGNRAELIKRAVWRWIRTTAQVQAKEHWRVLMASRSRTNTLAALSKLLASGMFSGAPRHSQANPITIVRLGHWLVEDESKTNSCPIVPVIWGLALIGATWRKNPVRGICEFCYRHAYPGKRFCYFHRQGGPDGQDRSKAYIRYRKGRLAAALDEELNARNRAFAKSPMMDYEMRSQSLSSVLFPMVPLDRWDRERQELIEELRRAPRVLETIGGEKCLDLPYETIVEKLRLHIDPCKFDDFLWWASVWRAEEWYALENKVSPGLRGRGRASQAKVRKAIALAQNGATNGQIAQQLGVAPSTVSSWVKRYADFRKACQDRADKSIVG